jgi:hypothetical protein
MMDYSKLFHSNSTSGHGLGPTMPAKWGWMAFIDRLAGGDITKHEAIFDLNYIYCLNQMGYWHDRDEYTEAINKRNSK